MAEDAEEGQELRKPEEAREVLLLRVWRERDPADTLALGVVPRNWESMSAPGRGTFLQQPQETDTTRN